MFGIVSRCSRERNFYAAGMEEVSMRSFASAIDEPMLFQIGNELPNLTGHTENITEVKTSKQRGTSVSYQLRRSVWPRKTNLRGFTLSTTRHAVLSRAVTLRRGESPRLRDEGGSIGSPASCRTRAGRLPACRVKPEASLPTQSLLRIVDRLSFRQNDRWRCLPRRSLDGGGVKPIAFFAFPPRSPFEDLWPWLCNALSARPGR